MFRITLGALVLVALPHLVTAQVVNKCDWRAQAVNLVEPWAKNSRTFSDGRVRLAVLDTIEPGAGALNILVLSPPVDEMGGRQCRVVSLGKEIGFAGATLNGMVAKYDPATGLTFNIHIELYNGDTGTSVPGRLLITLNQATGEMRVRLQ